MLSSVSFAQEGPQKRRKKGKPPSQEKVTEQRLKEYEKARQESIQHRYRIQDKETQKRMKESRKKARRNNKQKKTVFFLRPFKREKAKKHW